MAMVCAAFSEEATTKDSIQLDLAIDVHGGITYAEDHAPARCSDGHWWFGFDAAHCDDMSPGIEFQIAKRGGDWPVDSNVYRNVSYMRTQTIGLARQLWMLR